MWRVVLAAAVVFTTLCNSGCALFSRQQSRVEPNPPSEILLASHTDGPRKRTIYVMSNGFHIGLILRNEDIPRDAWPEVDEIPDHPWVEVGWGSEIFYRAKKITVPVVMGAVVPNASVLHVVGWDESPEITFAASDLVRLEVDEAQFAHLCRHVHDTYALDKAGKVQNLGPGIYGDAVFFRAKGNYYFPKTCNVWTARGLRAAGVPIVPELCGAAGPVLAAARGAGTTIRRR